METKKVKVTAIFEPDGKIIPVKFRVDDLDVMVQRILKTYEEKSFGSRYIIFMCQHNMRDNYNLKYDIDKLLWYLVRR